MNSTTKEAIQELQTRAKSAKAAATLKRIRGKADILRRTFTKGTCGKCGEPLARMQAGRVLCAAGHANTTAEALAYQRAQNLERTRAVDNEVELMRARVLQQKRGRS